MDKKEYLCAENQSSATIMDIKKKIQDHNMTIVELADALGMSQPNLSKQIKNLETNLAVNLLRNIAKELGISVSELIDDNAVAPTDITLNIGGQSVTYKKEE